jgi:hypothetical protein
MNLKHIKFGGENGFQFLFDSLHESERNGRT